ncbi:SH3 domain-containing protein [Bacillus mycoides]|uniref:SH3 domain-containing protein n=1 Tax=Bacillus mycoides TaxID=1405 RepID=UPI001F33B2B4|nr:SH3 domain-containing protein [Bacillus mycoides]
MRRLSKYITTVALASTGVGIAAGTAQAAENNKVNVDVLNIRATSSISGSIAGKLYNGNPVNVLENMANGWSKINHNGKIAYIKTEFITINQPLQPKKSESVHPKGKAVVNKYFDVLSPLIEEEAARNNISEWAKLLKAITMQESTGNYIKYPDVMQISEGACGTIRCISDY